MLDRLVSFFIHTCIYKGKEMLVWFIVIVIVIVELFKLRSSASH